MPKICVIGIDGATWDLLNPMITNKKIPIISKIKNEGSSAKLISTMPPSTGSAWSSFGTGCNPNKHGIFDFIKIQKNYINTIVTAKDLKVPTIFEYLDLKNKKIIIINHPLTYGLKLKNGMIFADFLSPKIYANPKSAEKFLDDYRIFWNHNILMQSTPEKITEDILDVEKKRLKLVLKIIKNDWDLFFVLFSGTDWISHRYYSEMEKWSEIGKNAFKIFEFVDYAIGKIIEEIEDDTILIILSDHGFTSKKYTLNINHWFSEQGYLRYDRKKEKNIFEVSKKSEIIGDKQNYEKKYFLIKLENKIKKIILELMIGLNIIKKYKIDWESSLAYIPSHNCFGIYINKNKIKDYEKFCNELVEKLKAIQYLQTNEKVFLQVETTKNIYGEQSEYAPDILFLLNNNFSHKCVTNYTTLEKDISTFSQACGDDHSLYGIFMAYGKQIKQKDLEQVKIIDIAPTILNLMGYTAQKYMDGKSFAKQIVMGGPDNLKQIEFLQNDKKLKTEIEKEIIKRKLKQFINKK